MTGRLTEETMNLGTDVHCLRAGRKLRAMYVVASVNLKMCSVHVLVIGVRGGSPYLSKGISHTSPVSPAVLGEPGTEAKDNRSR